MATIKFVLRHKKNKLTKKVDPVGRIYLQYGHNSLTALISTGRTIDRKFWDKKKGRVKKHENATTVNSYLSSFETKFDKFVTTLQAGGEDINPDPVKKAYEASLTAALPESAILHSMPHLWNDFIEHLKTTESKAGFKRSPSTIRVNENSRTAFIDFLKANKISQAIKPENFTVKHLHSWEKFLMTTKDKHDKLRYASPNSRSKVQKHFKSYLKHIKKLGYKVGFDIELVTYIEKAGHKICIEENEIPFFEAAELTGKKEEVRDLILVALNVGMRISDFKRLSENIQDDDIVLQTQKTGEPIRIPITPMVRSILIKYAGKLPSVSEPVFRRDVKYLYKELFPDKFLQVKINGEMMTAHKSEFITPHSFIRTFVTISSNRGMTVPQIAKITGKSISVLLKHYLNVTQEDASKAMKKAWDASPLKINKEAS